ncbi:TPA: hypothetical protein DDX46_02455 [Candidatus Saccharibacteria bacterium]|nr:MAG: membrane protein of unknown function [Candidatus Saccharibacteria bacterium GW2011_GWC2_44_17]MBH1956141.1 hypothetical protein [Candidatus Saccharibacteria bacterium]OGL33211.1 MAG: hypothetical protein A3E20_01220 [Candidatus Saccharibacteria bacterium RIFCSPHIGHO2_12_FULL_47_16]MBH1972529.1 hypothetical protein [Candidatus Saccharibacteria bacterium]MBH1990731.1 hypothetical protein [Candidatus Saccharibacteria bacterium]
MEQSVVSDGQQKFIDMQPSTVVQVGLLGVIIGSVAWLLTLLLNQYVMDAVFCGNQSTTSICLNSGVISGNIVLVFATIAGVLGLVRLGVYRPLLVAIAAAICLWGVSGWVDGLAWFEGLIWTVVMYAICYMAFAWFARIRMFLAALILVLLVVVFARILPTFL